MKRSLQSRLGALILTGIAGGSLASDSSDSWGPAQGTRLPALSLGDHAGETRTFADLMGAKGLLVFFNRSADW